MIGDYFTDRMAAAILLANEVHRDNRDKACEPYLGHVYRVGLTLLPDHTLAVIGFLHDTLEDCQPASREYVRDCIRISFGARVLRAVETLTQIEGMPYVDYIQCVKTDTLAARVKEADLADNLRMDRLMKAEIFGGADIARLVRKYSRAIAILNDFEWRPDEAAN
jgi:(p)ppGpp synthase/HD superfamily hydrolase